MTIERLPGPPICYRPMFLGPWEDPPRQQAIRVIVWLWFYITIWVAPSQPPDVPA